MYTTLNDHYRARFGCKVYKLSLDAGFTCPNRDGTIDKRGCIFCSESGSGEFAEKTCGSLTDQLARAKQRVHQKIKSGKFIAYFQSFTNTYADVGTLERLYREAMAGEDIVALSIATRPDCLSSEIIDLLSQLNREKPIYVELGLQTVHPESIRYIRRGYENEVYFRAVSALKSVGIHVVTHIIIGLPGEDLSHAVETTRQAVAAGTDGVKFHLLHVLRGTDLARDYLAGAFQCLTLEEYAERLKACLSVLPENIVVHRITGDGAKRDLIAPLWSADKKRVLNYLNHYLKND
ncbi:MAG: TIGR01212 family radical SAM protein [Oscillospiraceae bacterium]|nr:TIGR01212 family radical SAM protein [Oscillospiraceae bacterium]